jgi:hypothetical protein
MKNMVSFGVAPFAAALSFVLLLQAERGLSQVRIGLHSQQVEQHKPFTVQVRNESSYGISFCADIGQSVDTPSGRTAAPNPFYLQRWTGKRWETQLIGTDVGNGGAVFVMGWKEVQDFPLQVNSPGQYRIQFIYSKWSATSCSQLRKHSSHVNSKPFSVHASEPGPR